MDTLYKCTPRQVREFVLDILYAGLVPFIQSSPGTGKSSIVKGVSTETSLWMIDHRLSTSTSEDLTGLPHFKDGMACFAPFADLFPIEGTPVPDGMEGWLLFLDEANSATKMVQAAAYKLILDRMVGQHKLHERVAIVMAGNLSTDRAIVNPLSTAMQSRVVHIEMEISFKEWLEDVAFAEGYDKRIIAYLNYKNGALMDFKPDHNEKTFCCPRTWEFMNKLVHDKPITDDKIPLYAGTITSGVAVDFVQFTKVYESLPNIKQILKDPTGTPVPVDSATRWAAVSHAMEKVDDDTFGLISQYIERFPMEFRLLFFRFLLKQKPEVRQHPEFRRSMSEMSKYLHAA
jgi:hypothetical protein